MMAYGCVAPLAGGATTTHLRYESFGVRCDAHHM